MDKYTCKNLIIDPETQGLEDIIGKEVYFSDVPLSCITWANNNCPVGILKGICKGSDFPFQIETPEKVVQDYACIIPKREEPKPKYVPFENAEEFLDAYYHNEISNLDGIYHYLATRGIWLEDKGEDAYYMVAEIWDDGVVLGDSKMETTKASSGKYFTINGATTWDELFENYAFLDGSPCGGLVETTHE